MPPAEPHKTTKSAIAAANVAAQSTSSQCDGPVLWLCVCVASLLESQLSSTSAPGPHARLPAATRHTTREYARAASRGALSGSAAGDRAGAFLRRSFPNRQRWSAAARVTEFAIAETSPWPAWDRPEAFRANLLSPDREESRSEKSPAAAGLLAR